MEIFNLFKPKLPAVRCMVCEKEFTLNKFELSDLIEINTLKEICPIIGQCEFCSGLFIPIDWVYKKTRFEFDDIYEKLEPFIKNNDFRIQMLVVAMSSNDFTK